VTTCERTEKDLPIDAIMTTFNSNGRIQAGYLTFDEGTPGDHRTLWMDIPFELIFGNNPPHKGVDAIPVAVKDPRVQGAYNKRVMKVYIKYGILEQTRHVKQAQNRGDAIAQIKPQIDSLIAVTTQIHKEAAVKIRKLKAGKIPWSPTLQAARDSQKLWTLVIRRRERKKVSRNLLKQTMKKCHMISIENISLEQAKANRKVAHAAYLKEVRKAPDTRKKHQESLAKALLVAEEKDTKKLSELKNLRQREKQRNQAR